MYTIGESKKFRKAVKKLLRSGRIAREDIQNVVEELANGKLLAPKYKDHELRGEYKGIRECHIESDLLLMYRVDGQNLVLILVNLGSHSELFG